MKYILLTLVIVGLFDCRQRGVNTQLLQSRIDSLEKKVAEGYRPGFGEFMGSIQAHHSKLWFAGQNQNWKLADFEVHEMMEALDDIRKFQSERKESELIGMLNPAIDSVNHAIEQKDAVRFKSSFIFLTNTCNKCHRAVNFEFNVVKIPETSPFSNQDFKVSQ